MKILHVVHSYPPSLGGSQWLVKNLSEKLVSQFGDDVTVFTTNALDTTVFSGRAGQIIETGKTIENGVTVHRFPLIQGGYLPRKIASGIADYLQLPGWDTLRTIHQGPIVPRLANAIAHSGADVVMATAFPLWHMFATLKGAKKGNIPLVFLGALHPADDWGYNRPIIFDAIHHANKYIALTTFEQNYLLEHGISAKKITVIGAGIDIPEIIQSSKIARQQIGFLSAPIILALGRQNKRKRFEFLLKSMPQVWQKFPDAQIIFAGAKSESTKNLQHFDDTRVHVMNNVSEEQKHTLLAACDVLVLPSTEESFGIVFIEAWAHSKPVIGADIGAMASLIQHQYDGLLFQSKSANSLANAICTLLTTPSLRKRIGQAGRRKTMEHYSWETIASKVRKVYKEAIKSH